MDALNAKFSSLIRPCLCLRSIDSCSLLYNRKVGGSIPDGVTGIFY
jgi:hypothetical protein